MTDIKKVKVKMKTPLSYYGGKQTMVKTIVNILEQAPAQKIYVEPFFGGGAVFFAREKASHEVINDKNSLIVTFWRVLKKGFPALKREIDATIYSRELFRQAGVVLENPDMFDDVKIAWAIWTRYSMSFGHKGKGYGYGIKENKYGVKIKNCRDSFTETLQKRLACAEIECADALRVIERRDTADTLFYIDPPYVGANQGPYAGYTQRDFEALLSLLEGIKGCFLLSSYKNEALSNAARKNGWEMREFKMYNTMNCAKKTEVLTANFPFRIEKEFALRGYWDRKDEQETAGGL